MALLRTACPLDCPDTCTLDVTVDGGRLVAVDAAPADDPRANPLTAGFICHKVKHHAARVHGPHRVLTPLLRSGPKGTATFRAASWDEALDLVAARVRAAIDADGPASVVPYLYNSSAGEFAKNGLATLLWRVLGTSHVEHTICAATASAAYDGTFPGLPSADPADIVHSRLVVIWGANPSISNTHLPPLVARAAAAGASVVVVDPRRTAMAKRADLHLAVRPGTDVVLAGAVARELSRRRAIDRAFCDAHATGVDEYVAATEEWTLDRAADVCGLDRADIVRLVDLVAATRPAMLRLGWGLERNRNGGSACRAVLALWVLAGHFGRRGAGVLASTSGEVGWRMGDVLAHVRGGTSLPPPARAVNMNRLGRLLLGAEPGEAPVRVLFVQGANPAVMNPDQRAVLAGLASDDVFTVVHDQVLTDTAVYADVVLPATTHFEADDWAGSYGSYTLQRMPAVIDRVGESRTNAEVAAALAVRLGLPADRWSPDVMQRAVPAGAAGDRVNDVYPAGSVQFADTFPHGGRARLVFDGTGADRVPRYCELADPLPLTLISPATPRTINSIFGESHGAAFVLSIHPGDAAARGIADGAQVRVVNHRAELTVTARLDADLRPGVVHLPKGVWLAPDRPLTANALCGPELSDLAGGATFNDATVDVVAL
jgi:anaerobic selenocysteine-containing dehydrogenase